MGYGRSDARGYVNARTQHETGDRLRRHLISAHGFDGLYARLHDAEAEHTRDHGFGVFEHAAEDLHGKG